MTGTILHLLTRLSEAGDDAILTGELAAPHFGPVFDRLLSWRALIEGAPLAEWEVCDACDCGLPFRVIRPSGDVYRADCPVDRRRDVVLSSDDRRVFRIGRGALASIIGAAAGFGDASKLVIERIWRLGEMSSGRVVFLTLEPAAITGPGIVTELRHVARGRDVTILAPSLPMVAARRLTDAGFLLVETLSALRPASDGFGVTIDYAALTPVPVIGALRVRRAGAEVQWKGRRVILSHQLFPVFERLVAKSMSRDQVASGSHVEGTTGREAKDLIRELRDAFKAAGLTDAESKALIVTVRNRGYRLDVPACGIVIDD